MPAGQPETGDGGGTAGVFCLLPTPGAWAQLSSGREDSTPHTRQGSPPDVKHLQGQPATECICPGHAGKESLTWCDCAVWGVWGVRQRDGRNDVSRCLLQPGTRLVGPESALPGSGRFWIDGGAFSWDSTSAGSTLFWGRMTWIYAPTRIQ